MATPLRPPRLTGDSQTDLSGMVEFLWSWYRAIVEEREYIKNSEIGQTVQPNDAQLAAIAALEPADANNLPYFTGVDSAALTALTAFARTLLDDPDAATFRTTLELGALAVLNMVGTSYISDDAVTYPKIQNVSATDKLLGRSTAGAGDIEEIPCTAAGRAILDDTTALAQRTTLGVGVGDTPAFNGTILTDNLVLSKTSGKGIKVDVVAPTFGWADIIGNLVIYTPGVSDPTFTIYRGNIKEYRFSNAVTNEIFFNFHIPHDHVPNTDMYAHVHWSQITVDTGGAAAVPGVAKWYFEISYSKGHGIAGGAADPFGAPITTSVTQQASTTQYGQMIAETVITDNGASLIDVSRLEPDGVIQMRMYRNPADAADTLNQEPFVHYCDLHYQTTGVIGTKQKSPDFYT